MNTRQDCWNTIGVQGDASCPELASAVHCRNCPTYAAGAQRQRAVPADDALRATWAADYAAAAPAPAVQDRAALAFRVGPEWLALPAAAVAAVAPLTAAHRIPHRHGTALLGLANVDGRLLPALDLALLLGLDGAAPLPSGRHVFARQLVFAWNGVTVALPVAELAGLVRFAAADVAPPPSTVGRGLLRCLTGVLPRAAGVPGALGQLDPAPLADQCARLLR